MCRLHQTTAQSYLLRSAESAYLLEGQPADSPILTLALTSDTLPLTKVEDLADTILAQKISQMSGVGLVSIAGGQKPGVRIQANPTALAGYGMSLEDVRTALASPTSNQAKGSINGKFQSFTIAPTTSFSPQGLQQRHRRLSQRLAGLHARHRNAVDAAENSFRQMDGRPSDSKDLAGLHPPSSQHPTAARRQHHRVVDSIQQLLPSYRPRFLPRYGLRSLPTAPTRSVHR